MDSFWGGLSGRVSSDVSSVCVWARVRRSRGGCRVRDMCMRGFADPGEAVRVSSDVCMGEGLQI